MTGPVAAPPSAWPHDRAGLRIEPAVPAWWPRRVRGLRAPRDVAGRLAAVLRGRRTDRLPLPPDDGRPRVVGRHPDADLVLTDPTISRWHARLERDAATGGWLLTDLGSTNGTRVNGWRVDAPQWVRPGDRLTFGLHTVVLSRH
jgi:hypothetical protein